MNSESFCKGSVEIYFGKDLRYITLAGNLFSKATVNDVKYVSTFPGIKYLLNYFTEQNEKK
uniref:Uncharacterized protein n=1 Tax=Gracilariopsis andersonii TaxID=172979 RepID=E5Q3D6_9FLOR|nr:hypothetical protein GAND_24 [Gracilariopsis andersonii]ADR03219.1 hypothetical protein GAND_24 [Gracilariopsis andersonii]